MAPVSSLPPSAGATSAYDGTAGAHVSARSAPALARTALRTAGPRPECRRRRLGCGDVRPTSKPSPARGPGWPGRRRPAPPAGAATPAPVALARRRACHSDFNWDRHDVDQDGRADSIFLASPVRHRHRPHHPRPRRSRARRPSSMEGVLFSPTCWLLHRRGRSRECAPRYPRGGEFWERPRRKQDTRRPRLVR